ncbi:MAG: hypothetical protein RR334_03770 [Clostridia bacterium]
MLNNGEGAIIFKEKNFYARIKKGLCRTNKKYVFLKNKNNENMQNDDKNAQKVYKNTDFIRIIPTNANTLRYINRPYSGSEMNTNQGLIRGMMWKFSRATLITRTKNEEECNKLIANVKALVLSVKYIPNIKRLIKRQIDNRLFKFNYDPDYVATHKTEKQMEMLIDVTERYKNLERIKEEAQALISVLTNMEKHILFDSCIRDLPRISMCFKYELSLSAYNRRENYIYNKLAHESLNLRKNNKFYDNLFCGENWLLARREDMLSNNSDENESVLCERSM